MGEEYTYSDVLDANHYKAERDAALETLKRVQEAIDGSIEDNQSALLLLERDELREKLERAEKKVANLHERLSKHTAREKRLGKEIERINWLLGCRKREIRELSARSMPEGYSWPKFEDGKKLEYGDRYIGNDGKEHKVWHIAFDSYSDVMILRCESFELQKEVYDDFENGERIKRPPVLADDGEPVEPGQTVYDMYNGKAHVVDRIEYEGGGAPNVYYDDGGWDYPDVISHRPAVLAADGEPIEVGQTVWDTTKWEERTVTKIVDDKGEFCVELHGFGPGYDYMRPSDLTHQRPALDADGNRIEPAMDVWWVCEGDERGIHTEKLHVESIGEDGFVTCDPFNGGTWVELEPSELYVHKPVLDADGVHIKIGDTVWNTNGGGPFEVEKIVGDDVEFTANYLDGPLHWGFKAHELTHNDPNKSDSWDRVEDDATLEASTYCDRKGIKVGRGESFVEPMARDLVHRCKALAVKEGDHGRR